MRRATLEDVYLELVAEEQAMRLFWHQLKSEQLTFWRSREAAIFVFLFPPLLFVLLASVFGDGTRDGIPASTYLVAGLIAYAVANTALGGLAITLVIRREYGILKRLRSTPLPAPLYLAVALLSNLLVVVLQSLVVVALGVGLFDAQAAGELASFLRSRSCSAPPRSPGSGWRSPRSSGRARRSRRSST